MTLFLGGWYNFREKYHKDKRRLLSYWVNKKIFRKKYVYYEVIYTVSMALLYIV